ncbi:Uncharacterized protein FWK35_00007490 [Aphis craccivora]|uniref:Uncharacterized protein n=1 Tax=Aphis craccivora TaxID=307492 RepID=A0A6G0YXJ7_APHCR|nr:Uncharacterized protein FWK35_00007490 [Aphis craccivora]
MVDLVINPGKLQQKRKNGNEPIENRTYATYARVSNGKGRTPCACEVCCVQLTVKHIITEYLKYKQDRQTIELDTIFNVALGPKTEENAKMLQFLKSTGDVYRGASKVIGCGLKPIINFISSA